MKSDAAPGRNLILAGFMGTGKSTVGRLVALTLEMPLVDIDAEIEATAGQSIAEIMATQGEAAFRRLEAQICAQAAARPGQVIATGGGALIDPDTRQALEASGLIVGLTCDLETSIQRMGDGASRPLYSGDRARLESLYAAREKLYRSLPHQIDTSNLGPEEAAREVVRLWHSSH